MTTGKKLFIGLLALLLVHAQPVESRESKFGFQQKNYKPKNQNLMKVVWKRSLKAGKSKKRLYPENSFPVYADGNIYVGTHGGHFYSIQADNGKYNWTIKHGTPISAASAVSGDRVVFTDLTGHITCVEKSSGTQIWKHYLGKTMLSKPLIHADRVFVLAGEHDIVALSLTDGHKIYSRSMRGFVRNMTMHGQGSLVGDQAGRLYVGLADGNVYALAGSDGKILWEKSLTIPLRSFKDIDGTVVLDGEFLYAAGYSGALFKINRSSGQIVWQSENGSGVTPLVLSDDVVISNLEDQLVAFSKESGKMSWSNELDHSVMTAPVLVGGRIFVVTTKGNAFVLDAQNGDQLQKISLAAGTLSEPLSVGDDVYVLTGGAQLIKLGPSGK